MRHRIAIGGIHIESSTFSPHRSGQTDFTVVRGDELLARYDDLPREVDWVPLVHARALPGGAVERDFYESAKTELLERSRAALPLDGVFLDIHGAMTVVGMTDAEGDLASSVRSVVGRDPLISAAMDPHGNMSRRLVTALDLATSHRLSPHEDAPLTRKRAVANLVRCLDGRMRPVKAWVRVPVLLPGEKACTRDEPARSIYGGLAEIERRAAIIDAAVWIGYAWADEPRCQAAVVVTGDDEQVIAAQAKRLADAYWGARDEFKFVAPTGTLEECLERAVASTARPFFISDSGDNPTAGGAGDTSYTLDVLLRTPAITESELTTIYAAIVDPDVTATATNAGVGTTVRVKLGGKIDAGPRGPVELTAEVVAVDPAEGVVVLGVGGLRVIVTERRKPYHLESDFTKLGLAPRDADLVIVKIGYLEPELYAMAADWLLALTPGGVNQDLLRLGHHRIERPMFPFDPDMPDPDLTPELL